MAGAEKNKPYKYKGPLKIDPNRIVPHSNKRLLTSRKYRPINTRISKSVIQFVQDVNEQFIERYGRVAKSAPDIATIAVAYYRHMRSGYNLAFQRYLSDKISYYRELSDTTLLTRKQIEYEAIIGVLLEIQKKPWKRFANQGISEINAKKRKAIEDEAKRPIWEANPEMYKDKPKRRKKRSPNKVQKRKDV